MIIQTWHYLMTAEKIQSLCVSCTSMTLGPGFIPSNKHLLQFLCLPSHDSPNYNSIISTSGEVLSL
ncbi:hypothetical protein Peur_066589 [Populus x canadensis]